MSDAAAVDVKPEAKAKESFWNGNRFAMLLVATTFFVSLAHVMLRESSSSSDDKIVLTLSHWQLEPGVTQGFEHMAKLYNIERVKQGLPEIRFKQMPISEQGYGQWVTTQLMGGTPPDLIEMGQSLPYETWVRYRAYYFVPITAEIFKPNPYNKGTIYENEIWKNTFKDGMGEGVRELQEYYDVGLSAFACRMYFNPELLKELTRKLAAEGKIERELTAPPQDLREFFKLCDLMAQMKDEQGRVYLPIAGGTYQFNIMNMSIGAMNAFAQESLDENMDCWASNDETFVGVLKGRLKFDDKRVQKFMQLYREVAKRLPPGWNGLSRDDAVMQFLQWRSVFIATGSWDGMTLKKQAEESVRPFKVGISTFPLMQSNDPEYGELAWGRPYENPGVGFPFAITKQCKHPEVALDFLRFLSSVKGNEELNRIILWIPVNKAAQKADELKAFEPNYSGPHGGWSLNMGGKSQTVNEQINPLLYLGEDSKGKPVNVDDWSRLMSEQWLKAAVIDYEQRDETMRDQLPAKESVSGLMRAKMMNATEDQWRQYYRRRYIGSMGDLLNATREIARRQRQLIEAREKGELP